MVKGEGEEIKLKA